MKRFEKSLELGGRILTLSTGDLSRRADAAVLARYGDTVVFATVVASELEHSLGYFPLTVEYQERLYAGGRIKGSRWIKREGKPSDEEILKARLIDRSIRPLFPEGYKKEVQVIVTVLSVDIENDPAVVAPVAVSACLAISSIPWNGPVSVLKVGLKDSTYFVNPLDSELAFSDLDLVVSSTEENIVMIEAGAKQVPEEQILGGVEFAVKEGKKVIEFIREFAQEAGMPKEDFSTSSIDAHFVSQVEKLAKEPLEKLIPRLATGESSYKEFDDLKLALLESFNEEEKAEVGEALEKLKKKLVRQMILAGKRPDGRKHNQIRSLRSEVGVLPRTHGSAIFERGETQVLTVTTLGAPSLGQFIESAEGEEIKRYMHHYSMPPYATGETGRVGSPSRREIGHGALAERALVPVIPSEDSFPYAIRVVSEVLSSNGSTSMASVCGSTLSLMDAGVPIKAPVSGIAMGVVIQDSEKYAVLSDISGIEDANGDMDFKVAGTEAGVTALQLDVKTLDLTVDILSDALKQAREGRMVILESMLKTLPHTRDKVSNYAPKVKSLKIPQDKIGDVIGPGGKTIKSIISATGTEVSVEDDGTVNISGIDEAAVERAYDWVSSLVKEVAAGEIYEGVVRRIQPFGAFVEILPGKEGLVHVSDMAAGFVKSPSELVKIGDKVTVRVKEIDELGRINLSMKLDPGLDKNPTGRGEGRGGAFDRRRSGFSRGRRDGSNRKRFGRR